MSHPEIQTDTGFPLFKWEARQKLGREQGNKCCFCGVTMTWNMKKIPLAMTCATLEHIIPKSKGGKDHINNLAVSCWQCNSRRKDKPFGEFAK